ncbi:unnamed protein product [Rotaria sp. Silwood2]|nr:unnamed protein product [Rotaria sp. Silwood2]CAF4608545.1 unnamed protein product [Rotaria sp. Silwood2]CAF4670565.1 unnamed protein product [Rotaria sp. Silwood2]
MKISIILVLSIICSYIDGKRLYLNNDNDLELSNEKAQMFLRSQLNDDDDQASFDTREFGKNCVPCKFKINPCCAPNICIKKFFWNECMEIKAPKPGK